MAEILFYVGFGIFVVGGFGLLIAAFRTSILWGLAVLLVSPVALFYVIVHWQDAKEPFKLQLFGIVAIVVSAYMNGGVVLPTSASSRLFGANSFISPSVGLPSASRQNPRFRCDGRQYCSQMHSRAEAEFFTRNCPDTRMDGDHDGIPCESDSRF